MPLTYSEVESLFRLGRFNEIAADCGTALGEIQRLPSYDHQLTIAESLGRTGRLETASYIARQVLSRPDHVRGHARCEMILGTIARDLGRIDEAMQSLQRSLHAAKETSDISQAARSALAIFRIVSERQPPEVVTPLLAEVRRLTTRAADPHLTALLHESVARQEAQVGNLEQARRHLRIAYSLLEAHPNALISATLTFAWRKSIWTGPGDLAGFQERPNQLSLIISDTCTSRPASLVKRSGH